MIRNKKLHIIFTKDGINPSVFNIEEVLENLVFQKQVHEIRFSNPLVLDMIRLYIKEGRISDKDVTMTITNEDADVECKFIDRCWVMQGYEKACQDIHMSYPTNEFLNFHENLLMRMF